MGQPTEALAAYEASLREAPNRFNSLYGAARAAERSQNIERARALYAALVAQCVANSPRPELAQARKFAGDANAAPDERFSVYAETGGRVIAIGSCNADRVPFAGGAGYAMSKAALGWSRDSRATSARAASPSTMSSLEPPLQELP
jgi:hypothetical protein